MTRLLMTLRPWAAIIAVLVLCQAPLASEKPPTTAKHTLRTTVSASPTAFTGAEEQTTARDVRTAPAASLGAWQPSSSPGELLFQSYRDQQHNSTMGRMNDWRPGTVSPYAHFGASFLPATNFTAGQFAYQVWDPKAASYPNTGGLGCRVQGTDEYGFGVNIAADPTDGAAVIAGNDHHTSGAPYHTHVYYDGAASYCYWGTGSTIPDTLAERISLGNSTLLLWPKLAYQRYGSTTVTHLVTYQSASPVTWGAIAYFRKVGAKETGTWTGMLIDSALNGISPMVCASRTSQRVAVCWTMNTAQALADGGNQLDNDVLYRISADLGATWGDKVNVTDYAPNVDGYRAYAELSALFASDDKLHIVWPARVWPGNAYEPEGTLGYDCRIFHWSENFPSQFGTVARAEWENVNCLGGAWQLNQAKVSLGECAGRLYAVWTQFNDLPGGIDDDCASSGADHFSSANGDIWLAVSDDLNGLAWDQARNLTNSYTPNCDTVGGNGPCDADGWPAINEFGMDLDSLEAAYGSLSWPTAAKTAVFPSYTGSKYIHMQYVNDRFPGNIAVPEGIFTLNPVNWIMLPCVDPVPNPVLSIRPTGTTYPAFILHGHEKVVTITMENQGNVPLTVSSITELQTLPPSPDAVDISITGPVIIPSGVGNSATMTVTLNKGGIINAPGTSVRLKGLVSFLSNSPAPYDSLAYAYDVVIVDSIIDYVWDTLATGCTRLVVGCNGNMGQSGSGKVNMDYWNFGDCDTVDSIPGQTDVYVYDASPVILRKVASPDTVIASWSMFGDYFSSPYAFRPVADKVIPIVRPQHTNAATYQKFTSGQFVTVDSQLAVELTYWAPTTTDSCNFIIQKMLVFPYKGTPQTGLTIGQAFDFDVPADTATYNRGGWQASLNLVYQQGWEYQSVIGKECQKNDRRFAGAAMLGYYLQREYPGCNVVNHTSMYGGYTALNSDYVYPTGSFVPRELWTNMSNVGLAAAPDYADQHTVLTYKYNYSLAALDTLVVYTAIATIKRGTSADLQTSITKAKNWYWGNLRGGYFPECCEGTTGDVDGSWSDTDISDLTAMVDYLFFGGYINLCFEESDVNADRVIDISDLQALIDYLFFGVMLPECVC